MWIGSRSRKDKLEMPKQTDFRAGLHLLPVISTGRTTSVCSSIPRWVLRHRRRLGLPCSRACRSPSPSSLILVLSISRFSGLSLHGRG